MAAMKFANIMLHSKTSWRVSGLPVNGLESMDWEKGYQQDKGPFLSIYLTHLSFTLYQETIHSLLLHIKAASC